MARVVIVAVVLVVLASIGHSSPADTPKAQTKLLFVNDVASLLRANPQIKTIPLNGLSGDSQVRYTAGNRTSDDRLVSYNSESYAWGFNQDLELSITYPDSGVGAIVTAVDIFVNQSSRMGAGYILTGGIGQRSIVVVIESYNTLTFSFASNIYGV